MAMNNPGSVGKPMNRVDGRLKVTGAARYAADWPIDGLTYGVIVQSTIGSGRVASIDVSRASKARGVIGVLTHKNAPKLPEKGRAAVNPPAGRVLTLLQDDEVHYNGQPIAVVVADTFEHATDAATMVGVVYDKGTLAADFDAALPSSYPLPEKPAEPGKNTRGHYVRGDVDAGLASADVRIEQTYTTPKENHNPMEPHAAIASWDGGRLTVYDTTQYVYGARDTVARTLDMKPEDVHIISPFVGGGFGCKGSTWSHVLLAAMASRSFQRPVKIALTRRQMFGPVGGRPQTVQHMTLGAKRDGTLTAIRHLTTSHTSFIEDFLEPSGVVTRMLYAVPNLESTHRLLKLNVGTPTFQRAPGEATGTYSVEVAMDELAEKLEMDPLALRLKNYAETDPDTGHPFSSKSLKECYRVGAERFGWSKRNAKAGAMRDGNVLVGYGMATATYPTHRSPATVMARLELNGSDDVRAIVQTSSQDLGTGTYTVMTQIAADALGLRPSQVRFELGDSHFPRSPVSGGSMSAASTGSAVHVASLALRQKLLSVASNDPASPMHGIAPASMGVSEGRLITNSDSPATDTYAGLLARLPEKMAEVTESSAPGDETKQYAMHAFGAVFAEARIDPDTRMIRIPRIVGVYGVGRVLNAKLAHSQLLSGMVWGVSQALREETQVDPRNARYVNADLAEYHVPVNADIHELDITFVDEEDLHVNPIGVKGIGEIGITGVAAAITNAIYNATAVRVRHLPIRLDDLL